MTVAITYEKIHSLRPADTDEAEFYAVPASTNINCVLRVCNQDTEERTCRVAHTTAGHGDVAADGDDWLVYDYPIPANEILELSIHAKATETIRVKASVADKLSFNLSGEKRVTS